MATAKYTSKFETRVFVNDGGGWVRAADLKRFDEGVLKSIPIFGGQTDVNPCPRPISFIFERGSSVEVEIRIHEGTHVHEGPRAIIHSTSTDGQISSASFGI